MAQPQPEELSQRIDIWLWHARFFKTRSLSTKVCRAGKVRLNGEKFTKAKTAVTVGDVLTFPQAKTIRIVKVLALSQRRGPAPEAQALYEDRTPAPEVTAANRKAQVAPRNRGAGRPTKSERRATDRLRNIFPD
ncbi:RNA-binding S4 domain-containing protein [Paremcibacter congregatus]|uniref:RNA-binding protein S4 n=1 Tax=Paremcibacter congregatus TaxID=2043170 RepID=A0A2G4YVX1_9PROT|nr:RNA-binding S4 domain-containing protein [Paremcibacter congregatus]PHZ86475.1 RNA-binding protein S4 [Paremcibacter congregatus]QDE28430.1 RNA-binding S4 domain-containing protein [Paremcibacter congregatus]